MRVRKAHFLSFIKSYDGDKSNVTEVHSAYLKHLAFRDKETNVQRTKKVLFPVGFISEKAKERVKEVKKVISDAKFPHFAKYEERTIDIPRKTSISKKWIALQLKKQGKSVEKG